MKTYANMLQIIISTLLLKACMTSNPKGLSNDFPVLKDRYFGEKTPALIPKPFDPQIVSPDGRFEGGTFSPDMKDFYFTRKNGSYKKRNFFLIRYENNHWGKASETDIKWPQFSSDGNTMYVGKTYKERTNFGWSELKNQGEFLIDMAHGMSVSTKGTYYFAVYKKEDKGINGSIHYSRYINGKNENPVKMGVEINSGEHIAHPHIAPDESYLIFDVVSENGYGQADIYISFKRKDGSWLPAINMGGKINTTEQESGASVTPDGKYLFFSRTKEKLRKDGSKYQVVKPYWVDAQVIENLRPK